jgi:hypothetical protein
MGKCWKYLHDLFQILTDIKVWSVMIFYINLKWLHSSIISYREDRGESEMDKPIMNNIYITNIDLESSLKGH